MASDISVSGDTHKGERLAAASMPILARPDLPSVCLLGTGTPTSSDAGPGFSFSVDESWVETVFAFDLRRKAIVASIQASSKYGS